MDIISIFTTAKEAGFEAGNLLGYLTLFILLRRDLLKVFDKRFGDMTAAFKEFTATVTGYMKKTEERMEQNEQQTAARMAQGEAQFKDLNNRLQMVEALLKKEDS